MEVPLRMGGVKAVLLGKNNFLKELLFSDGEVPTAIQFEGGGGRRWWFSLMELPLKKITVFAASLICVVLIDRPYDNNMINRSPLSIILPPPIMCKGVSRLG